MQNIINNKKIKKVNNFLLNKNKRLGILSVIFIVFLGMIYAFLLFSSVSTNYALEDGKEKLASITSANSVLESEVSMKKDKATKSFGTRLVAVRDVSYLDSSLKKLVYNN